MKTKFRNTCENTCELSKNKNIVILKQDKGRGVVVMDKYKYLEKCMSMLTTKHFKQVDSDRTKTFRIESTEITEKIEIKAFPI